MADKIVAEYTVKVDKAIKDLEKLAKKVDKVDDERKKTQDGFKSMSGTLSKGFKTLGGIIAATFAVNRIADFTSEAIKLAGELQGVERAFNRINTPNLLNELRKATKGTVSDLELMKQAVRASNFKIPLESLGNLFEFARRRAKETGESVSFLVNSIISGIGRKSPLILDNLGISAIELRKRLKGVGVEAASIGDVAKIIGEIAEEELGKMGEETETTADKMQQLTAATENMQTALGSLLTESAEPAIDFFSKLATAIADDITELSRLEQTLRGESGYALLNRLKEEELRLVELETEATEKAGKVRDAEFNKLNERVEFQREVIQAIKDELDARVDNSVEIEITTDLINKETEAYRKLVAEQQKNTISINSLNTELKDLQKDLKNAEVGSSEFFAILDKVTAKTKELNDAIALTKLEDALKVDVEEDENQDGVIKAQLDFLEKKFPEATKSSVDYADQLWQDHFKKKMDMNEEEYQQWLELQRKKQQEQELETQRITAAFEATSQLFSSFVAIQGAAREQELRGLEEQLNQGLIAREDYERKRKQILQQQAEDEKAAAIFEATVNGALAVVNAYNTDSTGILAGIVGAIVAAQIAAIAAQPVPQYEQGGFVDSKGYISGRSHKQGGVIIEAEGGEYITSKKYANKNKDILEAINSGQWEKYKFENIISPAINQVLEGGFENISGSIVLNSNWNDKNLLRAFDRNRSAARQDAQFIVDELSKNLKGRLRGGFA